jgi:hypothetical protein
MKIKFRYINLLALTLTLAVLLSSCAVLLSTNTPERHTAEKQTQNVIVTPNASDTTETTDSTEESGTDECEHSFSDWEITKEGGCLGVDRIRERECSLCGLVESETSYSEGHIAIVDDPAREATCTDEGLTEGKHCENCGEVILAQGIVPLRSHTYDSDTDADCNICGSLRDLGCAHANIETLTGEEPSCTEIGLSDGERCKDCGEIVTEQIVIAPLGHTPETVAGYEPTETEEGLSDGKICSVCKKTLLSQRPIAPIGYRDIKRYASDYAYNSLAKLENGEKMQEFYKMLDEEAVKFHTDTTIDATVDDDKFVVAEFNYADLGLTQDQAITVWAFYRADHPLYYWISARFTYNSSKLNLLCASDYAKGEAREEYNKLLFDAIRECVSSLSGETSSYRIALALHDMIITNTEYAYKADGKTPEDAEWAHNVLGVFEKGSGVCESYAKVFQLMLNYCGIENILVAGLSNGEDHAWNMAKMDDGEWYWFDLTWDDTPDWMWGISYNYFCVTDSADVSWSDGPWTAAPKTFKSTHTHFTPSDEGIDRQYALPERAKEAIDLEEIEILRDYFEVDGGIYTVISADNVQLIGLTAGGEIHIPERVIFNDVEYTVVSIGGMSEKLFKSTPIEIAKTVRSITIPATVSFIWDKALMLDGLVSIEVNEANETYTAKDGVLFTKSLYTLVQYPIGSVQKSYIIPDETVELANCSFGDGATGALRALTFGASLERIGTLNAGYGYRDADEERLNTAAGNMFYIRGFMNFEGEILLSEKNESFVLENGALYDAEMTVLYALTDRNATSYTCPETLKTIDVGAFFSCSRLKTVNVNAGLEEIMSYAFGYCSRLQLVVFDGDRAGWESIEKQSNWYYQTGWFDISFAK